METRNRYGVVVRVSDEMYEKIQAHRQKMEDRDLVEYTMAQALDELLRTAEVGE